MTYKEKLEIALRRVNHCIYGCDKGLNRVALCDRCCIHILQEHTKSLESEVALLKEKLKEALLHKVGPRQRNVQSQEG
jgi:hypothetical protein